MRTNLKKKHLLLALSALSALSYSCNNEMTSEQGTGGGLVNRGLVAEAVDPGDRVDNSQNGKPATNERKGFQSEANNRETSSYLPPLTVPLKRVSTIRAGINTSEEQQANAVVQAEGTLKDFFYIAYGTKDASNTGDLDGEDNSTTSSFHGYMDVLSMNTSNKDATPTALATYSFENIDLFGLTLNSTDNTLYAVGAANMDEWNKANPDNPITSNAVLLSMNTSDLNAAGTSTPYTLVDVPGRVAKDVVYKDGKVIVISGDEGEVVTYSASDFSVEDNITVSDGRSVAVSNDGNIYYLADGNITQVGGTSSPVNMDNDVNPGAQRLIGFYKGIYPLVPLGKNGTQIFSPDLSTSYNIPNVKNNNSTSSDDEQANQATMLSSDLIAIAEGSNGIMFQYVDLTTGTFNCAGGAILDGSPNDICVSDSVFVSFSSPYEENCPFRYIFTASGTAGTSVMKYNYPYILNKTKFPTYSIEWDLTKKQQNLKKSYAGVIYASHMDIDFAENQSDYLYSLQADSASFHGDVNIPTLTAKSVNMGKSTSYPLYLSGDPTAWSVGMFYSSYPTVFTFGPTISNALNVSTIWSPITHDMINILGSNGKASSMSKSAYLCINTGFRKNSFRNLRIVGEFVAESGAIINGSGTIYNSLENSEPGKPRILEIDGNLVAEGSLLIYANANSYDGGDEDMPLYIICDNAAELIADSDVKVLPLANDDAYTGTPAGKSDIFKTSEEAAALFKAQYGVNYKQ